MKSIFKILMVLPLAMLVITGCAQKADPEKPIDEIKAEIEDMSVAKLESAARSYANQIKKKEPEVEKLKNELRKISPKDLLGDKGKDLKNDLSELTQDVSALTKRYKLYADQLKKQGGDLSRVEL